MTTKKYFWITDSHFNFVAKTKLIGFFIDLQCAVPYGIFITGDISTGPLVAKHLQCMAKIVHCPIYFVLGNHDAYRASFEEVEKSIVRLTKSEQNLVYMTNSDPIELSSDVAVIGHDGWYDAKWRDPYTPLIFIWDFFFIKDFRSLFSNKERMDVVRERAKRASESIAEKLKLALKDHSTVYLLTHIPPWPNVGRWLIDKFWMPYNSSKVIADEIVNIMNQHKDKNLIVLAGHSHLRRRAIISDNIELRVGFAKHGQTIIEEVIRIDA